MYVHQSFSRHEAEECFWLRWLTPEPWVRMPPPQDSTDWNWFGFNEFGRGRLGHGTIENPMYIFGDASGGEDSRDNRLRRVGVGIAVDQELAENMTMDKAIWEGLPGDVQTVPRGELKSLLLATWASRGPILYITDCDNVYK